MQNTVSFKALLERCADALACRIAVSAVALGKDEFSGLALGYIGEGMTRMEPFYAKFKAEQATTLIIGEIDVLAHKPVGPDMTQPHLKEALRVSRTKLIQHCTDSEEGFWVLHNRAGITLKALENDPDCLMALNGALDERVWTHVSAHLGVPAGLEA